MLILYSKALLRMTTITTLYTGFNSLLSLEPLVRVLKKMIREEQPGARRLYQDLVNEFEAHPELLTPMKDTTLLKQHHELVQTLLSTVFTPSSVSNQGVYAISFPFRFDTVYASEEFKKLFVENGHKGILIPDHRTNVNIAKATLCLAFDLIQRKFYNLPLPITATSVHPFKDPDSGLTRYYELRLNAQFVEVKVINEKYTLPGSFNPQHTLEIDELKETFPLENFQFEGLVVMDVTDVTEEQVITEIKNALININAFSDVAVYDELQEHVRSLVGLKNVIIGITPFFKTNDYYLYTEAHYRNSLLFKNSEASADKDQISLLSQAIFRDQHQPLLYQKLNDSTSRSNRLLKYYYDQDVQSLILCPLKCDDGKLIGLLEIATQTEGVLQFHHVARIQPAIPLFTLALEKTRESLEMQIDRTIKEHFTAVQPAVEWKFTEAAFNYLQYRQMSEMAKMPSISFEDVYPLYGSIDIRNSSTERNQAIQMDMLEQLNLVKDVLVKAGKIMEFSLLQEMQYKIEKYISSTSEALLSDDEFLIYEFLENDVDAVLRNLQVTRPELNKVISTYFNALDPQRKILYNHRKAYEESITRINDVLDRFIDQEQQSVQEIYPHYFERYVTDGIEFNIYVGQSISPDKPFNEMYVRNLKLWQLTVLAKAARLSNALEKRLSMPLQTTQLILAHSIPLTISFRRKERKFDVDGAYNIRYEIVKKRIDKVHLRDSEERLTQPGKIGIVYSQQRELNEYLEYIDFLQGEKLLGENVEHLDLEDTQGISGLKAIRVEVNMSEEVVSTPPAQVTKVQAKGVLRR